MPEIPDSVKKKTPRQRAAELLRDDLASLYERHDVPATLSQELGISLNKAMKVKDHYDTLVDAFVHRAHKVAKGTK